MFYKAEGFGAFAPYKAEGFGAFTLNVHAVLGKESLLCIHCIAMYVYVTCVKKTQTVLTFWEFMSLTALWMPLKLHIKCV